MSAKGSLVLLSAGLDSAYNLYRAHEAGAARLAITVNYGQRASQNELDCARALCESLYIEHKTIDLEWFGEVGKSALLGAGEIPMGSDVDIESLAQSQSTAGRVWVPNRNGVLISLAAAWAEARNLGVVVTGFNCEEAATFPDNSQEYLEATTRSLSFSTANHVQVHSYSIDMSKSEIVKDARRLNLPFGKLWPCYLDGPKWCGECESCLRFKRALQSQKLNFEEIKVGLKR